MHKYILLAFLSLCLYQPCNRVHADDDDEKSTAKVPKLASNNSLHLQITAQKVGIFISLKWKALFLTSLVLLLVTSAFITLNYLELQSQFNDRREDLQRQYSVQVQALLNQFSNRLLMLSTFLASLQSTQAVFDNSHQKKSNIVGIIIEQAKKLRSSNAFQNSKSRQ